jgi:hypothetical protein
VSRNCARFCTFHIHIIRVGRQRLHDSYTPCRPTGPLFLSILCQYPCSRKAAGSRVVRASHHRWHESCHCPGDAIIRAGFGSQKSVRSGRAKRSRSGLAAGLRTKHTSFRPFSIGTHQEFKYPNRAILDRGPGSKAKSVEYRATMESCPDKFHVDIPNVV